MTNNAAVIALGAIGCFILGFRFYSRFLAQQIFKISHKDKTPAHQLRDGVDYVPARRMVLFGHHYASIAGAAPIVGPAVAVIWGWVPAILWVVLGTIFMGAVHDFGALVVSMKHRGQSMGQVCDRLIGPRARTLFLVVIFFLVWMVIAVFALVIANLFISFPSTVLPVNFQIIVALAIGYLFNRKKGANLLVPSLLAFAALLAMTFVGTKVPMSLEPILGQHQMLGWIFFLMIYSYVASILPVWLLLQPRDYVNSHQLLVGLGALVIGLVIVQPPIVAPAINPNPVGAPAWFPFLFITIACGAISGFHGLVSSGTTSKQVDRWADTRLIGYGGMLGEGLLALLATLAVTAGFATMDDWHNHYASWDAANGLKAKLNAFVMGSSHFLSGLGLSKAFSSTVIAVLIISFAATSLDTAARIQRLIVAELGTAWKMPVLKNRYIGGVIAIGTALALMFFKSGGKGGLLLWPLFGATNQMLAALSLTVISVYLIRKGRNALPYLIPVVFMSVMTALGLVVNIKGYLSGGNTLLAGLGVLLLGIQFWVMVEGWLAVRRV